MSAPLIKSSDCCQPCDDVVTSQVPGPKGDTGAAGTNGTDGINAFATTTASFTVPIVMGSALITVDDARWMQPLQIVYVQAAGYFKVLVVGVSGLTAFLQNLGYPGNAAPATVVAAPVGVSPGGPIGLTGATGVSSLNDVSPTTTKGDLMVDNGANDPAASDVRLAVGTNGQILQSDSAQPTGLGWKTIDLTGAATSLTGALPIANGGTGQITRTAAFDGLAPAAPATGDLLRYSGTHWVSFARGTANQLLRTNAGATDVEWATIAAGTVLQEKSTSNAAATSIATQIVYDDSIPQNTEGTQILSLSFTPVSAASRIVLYAFCPLTSDAAGAVIMSLFAGGADAIAAVAETVGTNEAVNMDFIASYAPGAVTPLTFTVRVGSNNPSTLTINGSGGARKLGGVSRAYLVAVEYT